MSTSIKNKHVVIVGAGMGGLATALSLAKQGFTHVDVYESAAGLGFVGAGIQLAPNMARILDRLGVWKDIEAEAVDLQDTFIRRSVDGEQLAHVSLHHIRSQYGYPHMVGHRTSLAGSLYEGCKREKAVKFFFSTAAGEVLCWGPKPKIQMIPRSGDPYEIEADILLAADGVKSTVRTQLLQRQNADAKIIDTGQAAYRIMLTREQMSTDPGLLQLIDREAVTRWIGEKRHIIAYPVASKTIYNISTVQPDVNFAAAPSATYTTKGSKAEMLNVFADFCPPIQRMLNMVKDGELCEWKLRVHEPLPFWVHEQTALIGDACHPTLPHLAQGAAQAIEDAAVLGVVLSKLVDPSPAAINKALQVYEKVRKDRAYMLVSLAAASGRILRLGDGADKEQRDAQFAALSSGKKAPMPDKWVDADVQELMYGVDIMEVADAQFSTLFDETC